MPEISFICIIYNLGEDNYRERLFGKMLIEYLRDDEEDIDVLVKSELKRCLKLFDKQYKSELRLDGIGILGILKDYYTSINDREIFDVFIDKINNKFCCYNREIVISNKDITVSDESDESE